MEMQARISGVAIPIAIPPGLAEIRARWDFAAAQGAQPHVTVLFPFLPEVELTEAVRAELGLVAALLAPFEVRFANVRRFEGVVWIERMLDKPELVQLLSHAAVFVCPSIYEPLGIVNLEAMACATAVVATATGGIPEVVEDGVTGLLVPFEPVDDPSRTPREPGVFAAAIAERVNRLLSDPAEAKRMGEAGRERAVEQFGWDRIAEQVLALYERLVPSQR